MGRTLGGIEAETLSDALVVRLTDVEVSLLGSKMIDEVLKIVAEVESLGDPLVDKLTEVEFELLFVKLVGVNTGTFGVTLTDKSGEGEFEFFCVTPVGLEAKTPADTLVKSNSMQISIKVRQSSKNQNRCSFAYWQT